MTPRYRSLGPMEVHRALEDHPVAKAQQQKLQVLPFEEFLAQGLTQGETDSE